jgi:hypothetical protein
MRSTAILAASDARPPVPAAPATRVMVLVMASTLLTRPFAASQKNQGSHIYKIIRLCNMSKYLRTSPFSVSSHPEP